MVESEHHMQQLVQRLLSRVDHLEYGLLERSQSDVQMLKDTVGHMQKARRLEAEYSLVADVPKIRALDTPGART